MLDIIWLCSCSDKSFELFLLENVIFFVPTPKLFVYCQGPWPSLLCMLLTVITHWQWEPRRLFLIIYCVTVLLLNYSRDRTNTACNGYFDLGLSVVSLWACILFNGQDSLFVLVMTNICCPVGVKGHSLNLCAPAPAETLHIVINGFKVKPQSDQCLPGILQLIKLFY